MSFSIELFTNKSTSNTVDKDIVSVGTGTGTLRLKTSITNPIVIFKSDLTADIISKTNYAKIQEFNRYYFINGITSIYNNVWQIDMHVDVLMTYKNEIRNQRAIIARQSQIFNMYLDDGWFMSYQNPIVKTIPFPNRTPFENQEYVLILAGNA